MRHKIIISMSDAGSATEAINKAKEKCQNEEFTSIYVGESESDYLVILDTKANILEDYDRKLLDIQGIN